MSINLSVLSERLTELKKDFEEWVKCVKEEYVTCKEFNGRIGLLEKVIFGVIGSILIAFLGSIIKDYIK
jgi:hypothetical protein